MNKTKAEYMKKYRKEGRRKAYDDKRNADEYKLHKEEHIKRSTASCNRPLYRTWSSMKQRCLNPKHEAYPNYGGRGIKVCDRWMNYDIYIEDILKKIGPKPEDKSLDRIDNEGHYEPDNVRWATRKEQNNNKRKENV